MVAGFCFLVLGRARQGRLKGSGTKGTVHRPLVGTQIGEEVYGYACTAFN